MTRPSCRPTTLSRRSRPELWKDSGNATVSVALTVCPHPGGQEIRALRERVDWLEIRADLIGDLDPRWLRRHFDGPLVYTLLGQAEGGEFTGTLEQRHRRLVAAAASYDMVDLRAAHDLVPEVLDRIPPERRRVSWHGPATDLAGLRRTFETMSAVPAALYVLSPRANRAEEALPPLLLLKQLGRRDVTAFGTGPTGTWSRILAPWLGAPLVYGRIVPDAHAGVPTVEQLLWDYGFPALPPIGRLCGIVGGPDALAGSLSPRLHNAAYRELGIPALFLSFQAHSLARLWREVLLSGTEELGLRLGGITVAAPHKETALRIADEAGELARRTGAANVLYRSGTAWRADTTNAVGVVATLAERGVSLLGRRVAVVGCGGAGRAAAAGLKAAGARTTLVDRDEQHARYAGTLLGLPYLAQPDFVPKEFTLLVNATPLADQLPFPVEEMRAHTVVVDLVYRPEPTALIRAVREARVSAVDGWDVLLVEADRQFTLMTGRQMPLAQTRALLWAARAAQRRAQPVPSE